MRVPPRHILIIARYSIRFSSTTSSPEEYRSGKQSSYLLQTLPGVDLVHGRQQPRLVDPNAERLPEDALCLRPDVPRPGPQPASGEAHLLLGRRCRPGGGHEPFFLRREERVDVPE